MAGIWSKKAFDYKNGEDRVCKVCSTSYHTKKPTLKCRKCLNLDQQAIRDKIRLNFQKKDHYPLKQYDRFCSIRNDLSNAWKQYDKTGDKSSVNAHYEKQLKEIEENGIMTWILDRRTEEKKENNGYLKTRNKIKKDLPDTRGLYEE